MKVILNIPPEFEEHFNIDKFEESLQRVRYDIHRLNIYTRFNNLSSRYEIELLDMLTESFINCQEVD